jgi:hypothetical protein
MRYLILFLLLTNIAHSNCRSFQRAEELLDTRRFVSASGDHITRNAERARRGLPPEGEMRLQLGDISQARNYSMNFPAIRDLGFPPLNANTWRPHTKRAVGGSRAGGLRDGWEINHNGQFGRVRLDYDHGKGMHYNIELEDARGKTHKLSVEFKCNNRPCTEADYLRYMQAMNR